MIQYRKILEMAQEGLSLRTVSASTGHGRPKVTEILQLAKEKGLELNAETLVKFLKEKNDCSCRLSFGISDRIEGLRKDAKEQCHKQFGN